VALVVKLNTRILSPVLGVIQDDGASYWDAVTGVNLNRVNNISADLSGFSSGQLVNIANAVKSGRLTLVSGSLPSATDTFKAYSNFASAGAPGGPGWTGITGVSAAMAPAATGSAFVPF
jgi:N-methylhydantoinase B/oxoprolinase/acetone carboxylase alpha subunit